MAHAKTIRQLILTEGDVKELEEIREIIATDYDRNAELNTSLMITGDAVRQANDESIIKMAIYAARRYCVEKKKEWELEDA